MTKIYNKITIKNPYVAVVGGGTGGHIFPAQSLCEILTRQNHNVLYITDKRGQAFHEKPKNTHMFILDLPRYRPGIMGKIAIATRTLIEITYVTWKFMLSRPSLVIGFGGYPSFPPLFAALILGIPYMLHEQNAYAGRVTRWLAPWAQSITTIFRFTKGLREKDRKKIVQTGNPIRDTIKQVWKKSPYKPPHKTIHLFAVGGSQGARIFSTTLTKAIIKLPKELQKRLQITQQCRPEHIKKAQECYKKAGLKVNLAPFFKDMAAEYKKAHLVISRAGASTVTELTAVGRPALLIPLPTAMDDHQMHNALTLSEKKASWYMRQSDVTPESLAKKIEEILKSPKDLEKTAENLHNLKMEDADKALTEAVEAVLNKTHRVKK
ncbi:MAG: undecaprenyldiphospho-muramoylpentapeptide beta-N-acetylglucosaminyltransferase [Holosporaceae bacterium]|nr:MAG: undecaprenyldiphospho-muramoylpentapeptide beta-N-acetylglucosaminyltransferase [Holosporaceae bacterium]